MGRTIQLIRGTSVENSNFTGPEGSLAYDTDTGIVRVHDGITKGGISKLLGVLDCMFNDEEYESWYLKLDNQIVIQGGGANRC